MIKPEEVMTMLKLAAEVLQDEIMKRRYELELAGADLSDSTTDARVLELCDAADRLHEGPVYQLIEDAAEHAGRSLTRDELLALLVRQ
jgi:hypothetical protein